LSRSEALPDIPPLSDFVPGFEVSTWFGLGVPKNTPAEIIEKLNGAINTGLAEPGIRSKLVDLGASPFTGSPTGFRKFIVEETDKWAKVIKFAGIGPE
jgi:tripartite-type tricarboxylate transporter receptor subunit TctC